MYPVELQDFMDHAGLSVPYIFAYGSRVYETAGVDSDYDYIGVSLIEGDNRQVQLADNVEITLYYIEDFIDMIDKHHISALECLWQENLIPDQGHIFDFNLRFNTLRESISSKISHSWVKGKKKLTVGSEPKKPDDRYIGLKSLFHAFRICDFGIQIAHYGKITNYNSANKYWEMLKNHEGTWDDINKEFKSMFNTLKSEFKAICPKN